MTQALASDLVSHTAEWNGLFERVGSELRTLADAVNNLQQFLSPIVSDVVTRDPGAISRLQDLDLLEQSLHGLSDLMSCLDASTTLTDTGALATGVKTIRLAGLAARLASTATHTPADDTTASDLDLF